MLKWYYHYLHHPGTSRMGDTLIFPIYWPNISTDIRQLYTMYLMRQMAKQIKHKYVEIPPKDLEMQTWHT